MDAKLKTAIDKWRKADNTAWQKELELLYKSLAGVLQDMPDPIDGPGREKLESVRDVLAEDSQHIDSCVRWHLLRLAMQNAHSTSSTSSTSNANLQLAKAIMDSDKAGENLLFYLPTGKKIKLKCKGLPPAMPQQQQQHLEFDRTGSITRKQSKVVDANTNASAHFAGKIASESDKTLFAKAVCEGYQHVGVLVAKAQELLSRKPLTETITSPVRRNIVDLHKELVRVHKTSLPAFRQVLLNAPEFLRLGDDLLDSVIKDPLPKLASVILASPNHTALLTTHGHIVSAIDKWVEEAGKKARDARPAGHQSTGHDDDDDDEADDEDDDCDSDDDDDPSGDYENGSLVNPYRGGNRSKTDRRRGLVCNVLAHAPVDVLQSPEVLTALMRHSLLEDASIIHAYGRNPEIVASKARPSKTPPTFSFADFLGNVPGVLHMAVLYQLQPLVEALLRRDPSLAVTRDYVRTASADDGTTPEQKDKERKPSVETATAAVNGTNGTNGASSVSRDQMADGRYYPLWFNNAASRLGSQDVKDAVKWKQIRSALIYCTMKHAENVQTLLAILRESEEPEREINFDMSRLLIEGTSVADFVASMPHRVRSYSLIHYEETIRYADFPVLDRSTQPQTPAAQNRQRSHLEHTHREILDMLDWLYKHGVRRIITLRVPDRMAHPHDELEIAAVVRRFRVEELDWRILDLSLNIFRPHGGPDAIPLVWSGDNDKTCLTRLHLYTSGRRSALDHWFSTDGLESMELENVYIYVIKELTTKKQSDAITQYIRIKADELKKRKPKMQLDVLSQFWTSQTETPRMQEIIHHLSPRLAQFIPYYREIAKKYKSQFKPTKLAIIDNGILSMDTPNAPQEADETRTDAAQDVHSNNSSYEHLKSQDFFAADSLWSRICEGKSFVHEQDRVSPWYLASNPHGTQMANLVCAIDPLCQLFVAKIADTHYGYTAARAAAAVRWAMEKDVDIISMSFTTTEKHNPFNDAVAAAMKKGILVVCSHHDEGARISTEVFPASLGGTAMDTMLRMASCNMYGKLQHDWDDSTVDEASKKINQYDFCINSQDIAVGAIPFLDASTEHISGSSVATALAAGVCSLLIACLRTLQAMSQDNPGPDDNPAIQKMAENVNRALATGNRPAYADIKTYLGTMSPSKTNPRFIALDRFARLDELRDFSTTSLAKAFATLGANFTVG